jgi:hypothetical protein
LSYEINKDWWGYSEWVPCKTSSHILEYCMNWDCSIFHGIQIIGLHMKQHVNHVWGWWPKAFETNQKRRTVRKSTYPNPQFVHGTTWVSTLAHLQITTGHPLWILLHVNSNCYLRTLEPLQQVSVSASSSDPEEESSDDNSNCCHTTSATRSQLLSTTSSFDSGLVVESQQPLQEVACPLPSSGKMQQE